MHLLLLAISVHNALAMNCLTGGCATGDNFDVAERRKLIAERLATVKPDRTKLKACRNTNAHNCCRWAYAGPIRAVLKAKPLPRAMRIPENEELQLRSRVIDIVRDIPMERARDVFCMLWYGEELQDKYTFSKEDQSIRLECDEPYDVIQTPWVERRSGEIFVAAQAYCKEIDDREKYLKEIHYGRSSQSIIDEMDLTKFLTPEDIARGALVAGPETHTSNQICRDI